MPTRPSAEKAPGIGGQTHLGDAELAGERRGVQRPRAAECRQRELARVVAALHRDDLERLGHGVVDDVDHGGRGGAGVDAQRLGELAPDDGASAAAWSIGRSPASSEPLSR